MSTASYEYTLSKVNKDDMGAIINYITDVMKENYLTDTYGIGIGIERSMLSNDSWKVEKDGMIVAFASVRHSDTDVAMLANLYINPEYRQTKAVFLIFSKLVEILTPYRKVITSSLGGSHDISGRFCKDNVIDVKACKEFIERIGKRWEVVQKQ